MAVVKVVVVTVETVWVWLGVVVVGVGGKEVGSGHWRDWRPVWV